MADLTVQTVFVLHSYGWVWDTYGGEYGDGGTEDSEFVFGVYATIFEAVAEACLIEADEDRQWSEDGGESYNHGHYEIEEQEVRA